ncbi:MAG: SsrA-binding protein SmpB [Acidobacteriota bacterium]|mgnify:CR=1 FL=1|nr:SsrA-binding protein SmpB [Thermoanaerobaculaceae bacterium]
MMADEERIFVSNRAARHFYEILEIYEAGIVLNGFEVKSIRDGKVQIKDAYAAFEKGELFLYNCHISPYSFHTHLSLSPLDPLRKRKLLMHKMELKRLRGKTEEKGLTLVPLKLYQKGRKIKVEIALAKGKKLYDKRESIKKKDLEREQQAELKYQ